VLKGFGHSRPDSEALAEASAHLADGGKRFNDQVLGRCQQPGHRLRSRQRSPISSDTCRGQPEELATIGVVGLGEPAPGADVVAGRDLGLPVGRGSAAEVVEQGEVVDVGQVLTAQARQARKLERGERVADGALEGGVVGEICGERDGGQQLGVADRLAWPGGRGVDRSAHSSAFPPGLSGGSPFEYRGPTAPCAGGRRGRRYSRAGRRSSPDSGWRLRAGGEVMPRDDGAAAGVRPEPVQRVGNARTGRSSRTDASGAGVRRTLARACDWRCMPCA